MKSKAYSYIRFSTEIQKLGHSRDRQLDAAKKYAEENSLILDTNTYQDLGVSGFKGQNRAEGNLKTFLEAVDVGKIQEGAYLLIESLDRLSRQKVFIALSLLNEILERGIVVVTLMDGKAYTKESLNEPMQLMYSIMIMSTAHEESAKKSERVGKAWAQKRQDVKENNKVMTRKIPTWMEVKNGKIDLIPDRAKIVEKIFSMALNGHGKTSIARYLNENKIRNWNGNEFWHTSYVQKILTSKAVYGALETPNIFSEDYYPFVVSKTDFLKVQALRTKNLIPVGKSGKTLSNLFTGICACEKCGRPMHYVNKFNKNNSRSKNWRYLACSKAKAGGDCEYVSWRYFDLEKHILYSLREMDWSALTGGPERDFDGEILLKQDILEQIKKDLKKLSDDYMNDVDLPQILIDKMKVLEAEKDTLQFDIDHLKEEQILESKRTLKMDVQLVDEFYQSLTNDVDTRIKINQMIKSLTKKITFNPVKDPEGMGWGVITIHFITGGRRIISILDKEQTTSISVTSRGKSHVSFDTMITIKDEAVLREKVICNSYFESIPDDVLMNGVVDYDLWTPRYEKHTIKTTEQGIIALYPELKKQFEKDGLYTLVSDNKQDIGVIYGEGRKPCLVVESIPDLPPAPEDARFDEDYDLENET